MPLERSDKQEILKRLAKGERAADLMREYKLGRSTIYNWINRDGLVKNKQQTVNVKLKSNKAKATSTNAATVSSGEDEIQALINDFANKLKGLLIKQVTQSLQGM